MDRVRQAVHAEEAVRRGLSGKGVTVAVLDTGLSPGPDFYGRIVKFVDLVNGRKACYDDSSHGTHVCGILGGSGKLSRGRYAGIAPGCLLVPVKVLDRDGGGAFADVREGIWWVIENRKRYKIRILNLSVGTVREEKEEGDEAEEALILEAAEAAWDAGIVVVAASGNKGPADKSITVPGSSRKVITVGAYDDCGKVCYSEEGPTRNASVSRICVLQVPEFFRRPPWGQAGDWFTSEKAGPPWQHLWCPGQRPFWKNIRI